MAILNGRVVEIIKHLPHPQGDQVVIRHVDNPSLGQEIVQKKDVHFSDQENAVEAKGEADKKAASNREDGVKVSLVEVKENTGEFKGKAP